MVLTDDAPAFSRGLIVSQGVMVVDASCPAQAVGVSPPDAFFGRSSLHVLRHAFIATRAPSWWGVGAS